MINAEDRQIMILQLLLPVLAIVIYFVVLMWKIFVKAGHPGWASLVPIYNSIVSCQIAGMPGWCCIFMFIPYVDIVFFFIWSIGLAKSFGKGVVFAIFGLCFFFPIGFTILAFGADYVGPGGIRKGKGFRSRGFDDDDEDYDERPKRRRRDDDEDYDERPKRRRRDDDEEDFDRPKRRRRDDDEEDDERPKRRRDDDDEDDDRPRRRR